MASSKSDAGKVGQFKKRLQLLTHSTNKSEVNAANQILGNWSEMSTEDQLNSCYHDLFFSYIQETHVREFLELLSAAGY